MNRKTEESLYKCQVTIAGNLKKSCFEINALKDKRIEVLNCLN